MTLKTSDYPLWLGYYDMRAFLDNAITLARADECALFDTNGKKYLDMVSGIRNVILGYSQPDIVRAVTRQLETLPYCRGAIFGNEPALLLAKKLSEMSPVRNPRVLFHNSGSEAAEASFKIVRQLAYFLDNKKTTVIGLSQGYHGQTIAALSASGEEYSKEPFYPLADGFIFVNVPKTLSDIDEIEQVIGSDSSVGAVIIEPILGNGGVIPLPDNYLASLRKVCDENDILLICDEVTTGFGRCGKWFLSEGCSPDILIVGKAITNGYLPLSAVIVSEKIWSKFDELGSFRHGQTNLNHPACCACGLVTLKLLEELNAPELCVKKGNMLREMVKPLLDSGRIISIRGKGLMWALVIDPAIHNQHESKKWLQSGMLEKGFVAGQIENDLFLFPPAIITEPDLNSFVRCLEEMIA